MRECSIACFSNGRIGRCCLQRSMVRNVKMPLSGDDKSQVLHTLQGSNAIHFEKTLTASTAWTRDRKTSGLTVPSWFVQKHGDKLRQSAILRMVESDSSTKAWLVSFTVCINTPACTQVKFSRGWKAFATSNGLWEGDSLIFALTAMSEFEVYVFRSIERSCPSPALQRKWTSDSDRSRKKAKQSHERSPDRDEQMAGTDQAADRADDDEGKDEGTRNGVSIAERETVGETVADVEVTASAIGNSPPSCRKDSLHLLPGFLKKLTVTNVSRWNKQGCLEFPGNFWKQHGSRIGSVVELQGIREESPVRTMPCCIGNASTILRQPERHFLRAAWRAFVRENQLRAGQELYFALTVDSFFVVREVQVRNPGHYLHPERSGLSQDHDTPSSNTKGAAQVIHDSEG